MNLTDYLGIAYILALTAALVAIAIRRELRMPRYHVMRELDPGWQHVREALHGRYGSTEREG